MKNLFLVLTAVLGLTVANGQTDSTEFSMAIKGEFWELPMGRGYLRDENNNKSFGIDCRYFIKNSWAIKIGATHSIKTASTNNNSLSTIPDTSYKYWGASSYLETNKLKVLETNIGLEKYFKFKRISLFGGINIPMKFDLQYEEQRQSVGFDQLGRAGSTTYNLKSAGSKGIGFGINTGFNLFFNKHFSMGTELSFNSIIKYFDFADYTEDYINYDLIKKTTTTYTSTGKGTDRFINIGSNYFGRQDLRLFLNLNYFF